MDALKKLVNHQHKFRIFLSKSGFENNRNCHIDRITTEITYWHGMVEKVKLDYNEAFDTMDISFSDEWI